MPVETNSEETYYALFDAIGLENRSVRISACN